MIKNNNNKKEEEVEVEEINSINWNNINFNVI